MYADIRSLTRELATVIKRGSERVRTRSLLVSADRDAVLLRVCDWAITGAQDASIRDNDLHNIEVQVPYLYEEDEDEGESESESQTTFDSSVDGDDRSTLYNSSSDQSGRASPDTKQSFFDHSPDSVTATLPRSPVAQRVRTVELKTAELEEQVDILHQQNEQLEEELQHALEQSRNDYLVHLRHERTNWKGRFDLLKGSTREIELKLHSSEAARHHLEQELLNATREREILQAQLDEEHSEQSRLKRRLADTHTQLRRRCSEMEDLVVRINAAAEERTSRLTAELDSALAANAIARHAISVLEKEKAEGKALALGHLGTNMNATKRWPLVSELQCQVSALNEQLQAAHLSREVLEQEVHQLRHEATRQEREAEEEEEMRRMEAQRQAELEASRKRMQQMMEEEAQRKRLAAEGERQKKAAEEQAIKNEREAQEQEERCRRRDEENWKLSLGQLWSSHRAINRFIFVLREFETTQFSEAKPLTPSAVPWPVLISPSRFYVGMMEDWTLADKFFERARRSLPFDTYRDLISRTRQTFHPDRWRSRNLLNTVMDDPLRAVIEDAGNKVSQAVNRIYQDMLDMS
ncbi:uncharacterized protein EV420DRAFT_1544614 [Desarmillaria tabescens]|uniref:Uncharacterized protein n=1 Tax=Armillaria tabescens TaxID=1929756 RepID=A0AA39N5K2_ARMTA|nr:uncharacterized protein EV420DRAFT_1544614 [Desarmillaria tabescens]KAK0458268.1 hypothetical protein EV420DRAFT_1544614 [Desarmillaria tabescens]